MLYCYFNPVLLIFPLLGTFFTLSSPIVPITFSGIWAPASFLFRRDGSFRGLKLPQSVSTRDGLLLHVFQNQICLHARFHHNPIITTISIFIVTVNQITFEMAYLLYSAELKDLSPEGAAQHSFSEVLSQFTLLIRVQLSLFVHIR